MNTPTKWKAGHHLKRIPVAVIVFLIRIRIPAITNLIKKIQATVWILIGLYNSSSEKKESFSRKGKWIA